MDEPYDSQPPGPGDNFPEMTVSELSSALKRTIEDTYGFVRVRGELGRVVVAKSGHVYFDVKDEGATLNSVMWRGQASRLAFKPEEGLEVVAEGRLSTYPGRSNYQLIAERMRPAGVGALMQLLEERRKKLAAEGLFDAERKRPIPYLPSVIGVVTSPTGAVIRDILHRVRDRFPCRVIIWPALVQGERAAAEVSAGILGLNALPPEGPIPRPDVIIVARGGGSIEDLWPFNEEVVVRAAAQSAIPLISAVGHETDTTLIDFASDRRAPTPTGAAEMALPVRSELIVSVSTFGARLGRCLARHVDKRRLELRSAAGRLPKPDALLQGPRQRLDLASHRFTGALAKLAARKRSHFAEASAKLQPSALRRELAIKQGDMARLADQLALRLDRRLDLVRQRLGRVGERLQPGALRREIQQGARDTQRLAQRLAPAIGRRMRSARDGVLAQARVLETLSYQGVLARGFALVARADGSLVRSAAVLREGDGVRLRFADGEATATIGQSGGKDGPSPPAPSQPRPRIRTRKRGSEGGADQGDLF